MKEKFSITGMTCSACSAGIERTVRRLEGVMGAEVSLMGESMVIEYDESRITRDDIINAVGQLIGVYSGRKKPDGKRRSGNDHSANAKGRNDCKQNKPF